MISHCIILHNIRSAYNVGAILRTADAVNVEHVYFSGYTPCPIDRYGRVRSDIAKTALGAERYMSWSVHTYPVEAIEQVRTHGYALTAVEQAPTAVSLYEYNPPKKVCWVFGNEVYGVSQHIQDRCDDVMYIPMMGTKESLNISVAVGVVLFHPFT